MELLIIPVAVLLIGVNTVPELDPKYAPIRKLTGAMVAAVSLSLVLYACVSAIGNPGVLVQHQSIEQLLIPPILTLLFLPFFYLVAIISAYELLFLRVGFYLGRDNHLTARAKLAILQSCGLSLRRLRTQPAELMSSLRIVEGNR
jgi:hypothetical protein